jgi:cyclopropane-fatty-acyl-phospholipid synthase
MPIILAIFIAIVLVLALVMFLNMDTIYLYTVLNKLRSIQTGHLTITTYTDNLVLDLNKSSLYRGTMRVKDINAFCRTVAQRGEVGLGEMYMAGTWTSPDLVGLISLLLANSKHLSSKNEYATSWIRDDKRNIMHHYDVGNDFYMRFLTDKLRAYTCGLFFCGDETLDVAQHNKVHTIMKKLELKPKETVLDIGCGWGHIASYIASKTPGITIHGVTLSEAQSEYISDNIHNIKLFTMNYKDLPLTTLYDKIYSIEMIEAVRRTDYAPVFFKKVADLLKPNGRFVLQCITYTSNVHNNSTEEHQSRTFVSTHIFPGGQFATRDSVCDAAVQNGLKLVHMEVYGGHHYAKTLREWRRNLLSNPPKDDDLTRMYEYYLASMEACFVMDVTNITHFVFDKAPIDLSNTTNTFLCGTPNPR